MSTADVQTRYSPEDLLTMPDAKSYELVNGELVERNMGGMSSWVAIQLAELLNAFVRQQNAGWVLGADGSYQCFGEDRDRVRKPDVSFISRGRLPEEEIPRGHVTISPDLAIEVISPNDLYLDVQAKVAEYLAAGVRLVWVIDPDNHGVVVHSGESDQPVFLRENDTLTCGDVLPGFECRVADLFRSPAKDPTAS
jgi:Uma2 family endonuclease